MVNIPAEFRATATTGLNKYVWAQLVDKLGWEMHHTSLVPIVPQQEVAELEEADKPYIVYGTSIMPSRNGDFFIRREVVTYEINSTRNAVITATMNLLEAALNRYDISARDVNAWLAAPGNGNNEHDKFDYRSISLTTAFNNDSGVAQEESGRREGLMTFEILYTIVPGVGAGRFDSYPLG